MPKDQINHVAVATQDELKQRVLEYLNGGFKLTSQSSELATLEKRQKPLQFIDFVLLFLGVIACVIPGVLYAWWRIPQLQNMQRIVLRVDATAANASTTSTITWSDDGQWWWDGDRWRDPAELAPSGAQWSDDGMHWWDGQAWRPASATAPVASDSAPMTTEQPSDASPPSSPHPNGPSPQPVVDK